MISGFLVGEKIEAVKDVVVFSVDGRIEVKIAEGEWCRVVSTGLDKYEVVFDDGDFLMRLDIDKDIVEREFKATNSFRIGDLIEAIREFVFKEDSVTEVTIESGDRFEIVNMYRDKYLLKNNDDEFCSLRIEIADKLFMRVKDGSVAKQDEKTILSEGTETMVEINEKFKVGDRVQFKSWEEMEKEFGLTINGDIKIKPVVFSRDMKHLCGTYATISEIDREEVELKDFTSKGDTNWFYSLDMIKPVEDEPRWTFSEDEKAILRNLPKEYEWIARDKNNIVCIYSERPYKDIRWGFWFDTSILTGLNEFNHLFQSIKWSDTEPCQFRKYI